VRFLVVGAGTVGGFGVGPAAPVVTRPDVHTALRRAYRSVVGVNQAMRAAGHLFALALAQP
jgi:hypothetical protein